LKRRTVVVANSGLPYPIRWKKSDHDDCAIGGAAEQMELAGVPLGSFSGTSYDERAYDLEVGDLFVFCTDGVFDATDSQGRFFGPERLLEVVGRSCHAPARQVVDEIFAAVQAFRGEALPNDDMTAVAVKITV
jgi:sigma-B regulation protein RsbU (phosphoserine phosphatase)